MDQQLLILAAAVAGASALQAATGIGFGVVAGPVMLIVLNDGSAIQLSIALSFLIAALLVPSLWRFADRQLLFRLLAGSAVGLPIGLLIFLTIEIAWLKLLAGLAVLFTLGFVLARREPPRDGSGSPAGPVSRGGRIEQLSLGVISGAMAGSLAMPGPIPAAWMAARAFDKETVRATMLTMFLFSYLAAMALQVGVAGVNRETLWQGLLLVPPTLVGVAAGRLLAARLTERIFRRVLILVLAATSAGLFLSAIPNLVSQ